MEEDLLYEEVVRKSNDQFMVFFAEFFRKSENLCKKLKLNLNGNIKRQITNKTYSLEV